MAFLELIDKRWPLPIQMYSQTLRLRSKQRGFMIRWMTWWGRPYLVPEGPLGAAVAPGPGGGGGV